MKYMILSRFPNIFGFTCLFLDYCYTLISQATIFSHLYIVDHPNHYLNHCGIFKKFFI